MAKFKYWIESIWVSFTPTPEETVRGRWQDACLWPTTAARARLSPTSCTAILSQWKTSAWADVGQYVPITPDLNKSFIEKFAFLIVMRTNRFSSLIKFQTALLLFWWLERISILKARAGKLATNSQPFIYIELGHFSFLNPVSYHHYMTSPFPFDRSSKRVLRSCYFPKAEFSNNSSLKNFSSNF